MGCAHGLVGDSVFTIEASAITFGRGALSEVPALVGSLGGRRVALFTDARVARLEHVSRVKSALGAANIDCGVYDEVRVEPTDASFMAAARFAREGCFDAYVSIGGGSVIDTCKAAILYATYPAEFLTYVNRPVGAGEPIPGALPPHVACPTTSGTGSELTGIAVCDVLALHAKTGIASRRLRPTFAVVDPDVTRTLPSSVVAASGFDVLCHAIESYTAREFSQRAAPENPSQRPMSQGRNPWSDLGSGEALRLSGQYLLRAVADASDDEARERLMWAATLAGVAFGNAGVHLPHGMAYAVAGSVRDFRMPDYPQDEPLIPHGVSVVSGAPAAFRHTAIANPKRHLQVAAWLGEDVRGAGEADAGDLVAQSLAKAMRATKVPCGLGALGYRDSDIPELVKGTIVQRRLLDNAPCPIDEEVLTAVFRDAVNEAL